MQAAAERLEERKASFKAGPNGTRKRDEQQSLIRKDKRRNKLMEQRRGPQQQQEQQSILAGLVQFNQGALLSGNPQQLLLLTQVLQHATQTQAEEHLPKLLWISNGSDPVVLRFLVARCFGNEVAARALVYATHHVTSHDVSMAQAIVDAGFLLGMSKTAPTQLVSSHYALLWELVVNLVLSCPEGRGLILKNCFQGGMLPFLAVLRHANSTHDAPLQSAMIHLCSCLLSRPSQQDQIPPNWFQDVFTHLLLFVMTEVQSIPHTELDPNLLATLGRALDSLSECILVVPNKEMVLVPVLLHVGLDRVFRHLVSLCKVQSPKNQVAILLLLGRMSLFSVRETPFHDAAHRCGVFELMVHNATRPDSVVARAHAFLSFGNYLADHYGTVGYLMKAGAIPVMLEAVYREEDVVRRQALFAIHSMIQICDEMRRDNMLFSDEANAILATLLKTHKLLNPVVPFITIEDMESARCAVNILLILLRWNKDMIMNSMAGQDAEDRIQLLLAELKGQRTGTEFYNLICQVELLMDNAARTQDMDQGNDSDEDPIIYSANDGRPFYF